MSAIGGILDLKKEEVDFSTMNKMRFSMALRGRKRSAAFLCGGVGMFFNSSLEKSEDRQPCICERRGNVYALCIDTDGFDASAVLEKYLIYGVEFLGLLDGAFSLALYDGERDMLILARDKKGRRPLFYRIYQEKIYFASEVKGILDCIDAPINVSREALDFHLTSPMGIYKSSDIYTDVNEVLPGECLIFTKMGMSRSFYREKRDGEHIIAKRFSELEKIVSAYPFFDFEKLTEYLNDALIAFDHPQFDCFMPSLMELLKSSYDSGKCFVHFEDAVRRRNLSYAYEREDRLSSLYGLRATGTLPRTRLHLNPEVTQRLESDLRYHVFSMNSYETSLLHSVFGAYRSEQLFKKLDRGIKNTEDAEEKIRVLGMIYQTVQWMQSKRLVIDSSRGIRCAQTV